MIAGKTKSVNFWGFIFEIHLLETNLVFVFIASGVSVTVRFPSESDGVFGGKKTKQSDIFESESNPITKRKKEKKI